MQAASAAASLNRDDRRRVWRPLGSRPSAAIFAIFPTSTLFHPKPGGEADMRDAAQTKLDAAVGGGLMTTPLWALLLHDISTIASAIAAVCGAILGVNAVYRLWRRHGNEQRRR